MALYDPNESPAEVTTDFTLDDVLAWARTKPRDEAYDYCCNGECAIAQFLLETGRAVSPSVGPYCWSDGDGPNHRFSNALESAACHFDFDLANNGRTFGAFADRLEAARGQ